MRALTLLPSGQPGIPLLGPEITQALNFKKEKKLSILYSIQICSEHSSNSFKGLSEGQMCHCSSGLSFTFALLRRDALLKISPLLFLSSLPV